MSDITVAFHVPLRLELHNTDMKLRAILLEPFPVHVWDGEDHHRWVVPAGFETDLASVPRAIWWIPGFSPFGRIEKPSVLHDWLYWKDCPVPCTRLFADQVLDAGMVSEGENLLVRSLVYRGVRIGGASHWRQP
ncbi:MAG TPA: DUF1353 domain-containing protein [Fibrobacteria bacterium]|nr:DUF1353 domain-containing protein [Fibrobacteria bacterium]